MYDIVQQELQRRADWLMAGRYEDVASRYLYPYVGFGREGRFVIKSAAMMTEMIGTVHQGLLENGVANLQSRVSAVGIPRNGRFRIWEDRVRISALGEDMTVLNTIQFCRLTPTGIQTEMGQFDRISAPAILGDGVKILSYGAA